ncbi:MAG: VC0807 family protein [bacterium]
MEKKKKKDNALINILVNVVIPSVIMSKYSTPDTLGEVRGLIIALAFPLTYGIWDFIRQRKLNLFSALGLISVLLTGGIGLLQLDRRWMIAKETSIPLLMGIFVLSTLKAKKPLLSTFFGEILDLDRLKQAYSESGHDGEFDQQIRTSSKLLGYSFFFSAILNFVLAVVVLEGEPGTQLFTESLGRMTALSFPAITIPMMAVVGYILWKLFHEIKQRTNCDIEDFIRK